MKVIIAGSRDFTNINIMQRSCDDILADINVTEIVSGTARGADTTGEIYANLRNIPVKSFPADWNTHGKSAGYIRNAEMADYADMLIAFWDGKSRGTKHMIDLAKSNGLKVEIHYF